MWQGKADGGGMRITETNIGILLVALAATAGAALGQAKMLLIPSDCQKDTARCAQVYAMNAVSFLQNGLIDPTSMTLLRVTAVTKPEKHGKTGFSGCIRYVAGNRLGGRVQQYEGFTIVERGFQKGRLLLYAGWDEESGVLYGACDPGKHETVEDVTAQAKKFLSSKTAN